MNEPMPTYVEIWPVGCDANGLWLLDQDAWRPSLPIMADTEPHAEVELELHTRGLDPNGDHVLAIHSTSWRPDRVGLVLTYMVAVDCPARDILDHWPHAMPIGPELVDAANEERLPLLGPKTPPEPQYLMVLLHGIRHLAMLVETDDDLARALSGGHWQRHFARLQPAMARMYRDNPTSGAAPRAPRAA